MLKNTVFFLFLINRYNNVQDLCSYSILKLKNYFNICSILFCPWVIVIALFKLIDLLLFIFFQSQFFQNQIINSPVFTSTITVNALFREYNDNYDAQDPTYLISCG